MIRTLYIVSLFFSVFLISGLTHAQTITYDAPSLIPETSLLISPSTGSFEEESTFTVPILINTRGSDVNSLEVTINFDPNKLAVVGPSGETSIIGIWVEPPIYDNTRGVIKYTGVIPGGIITSSGLVSSITFKAKTPGQAVITVNPSSRVLLNDGQGTGTKVSFGRATYTIIPKATGGVNIFSETHPIQSNWYNNNNPIISWEKEPGVNGFSYELDTKPGTVPDNEVDTEDTTVQFQNLKDGLWYFHIKSRKNGLWGQPSSFIMRVDTTPPADFKPTIDYLLASVSFVERALVSFFTTDNLSGIDHYEVGVIDKTQSTTVSPIFVESESPFQVPLREKANLHVVVRAFDKAGNIRESGIDVIAPFFINNFIQKNAINITIGLLILVVGFMILHYAFSHHIIHHLKNRDPLDVKNNQPPTI